MPKPATNRKTPAKKPEPVEDDPIDSEDDSPDVNSAELSDGNESDNFIPEDEETRDESEDDDIGRDDSEEEEEKPASKRQTKTPAKKPAAKETPAKKATPAKKKTPAKKESSEGDDDEEEDASGKRCFKILLETVEPLEDSPSVDEDKLKGGGKYTGKNPIQAAKKAFSKICKNCSDKTSEQMIYLFSIKETTKGSPGKVSQYRGVRRKLDEPRKVVKGGTTYEVKFHNEVKPYKPGKEEEPAKTVKKAPATKSSAAEKKAPAKSTEKTPAKSAPTKKAAPAPRKTAAKKN